MDGVEATLQIRRLKTTNQPGPHIIALTANAFTEDREKCMQAGMCAYLTKPIRIETLEAELIYGWRVLNEGQPCICNQGK